MQQNAPLFDRLALSRYRRRTRPDALFLHHAARDEVEDRLNLVNRTFTDPAVVTPMSAIWADAFPQAKLITDDATLDLEPASHDLIVHAMGLHWAEDPVGQLIQCRRALRPDGLLLVVTLGGQTLAELRAVLGQAEVEIAGGLSPRVAPMAELRDLGGLLHRAGLALPVADSVPLGVEYSDALALMRDLRAMGETNAMAGRIRHASRRDLFARAAALYAEHFPGEEGRIRATFDLVCLTGWSPDDSQPKPLRPGSAQTRLADALNTHETKLPD